MGTKTRRSLSETDYSAIEVGELVKKTDQGKKRYALKKDGGIIYMFETPLPGKKPGYRCPECKCIVTAVFPRTTNIVAHWRHEDKNDNLPDCSLRVGKNLTKFMRYLDSKKQQRERGILDIKLEKRGFSGWRARTIGDDKHGFPVCENNKNSIESFENLDCHRRIFSNLDCKKQPAPYIRVEDMFKNGRVSFKAAEKSRKKLYDLKFEAVKPEQILLANELLGSSGFTRIRPGSYYSNDNDEIPNIESNKYIGITKNRLWQSNKDGPKPNHEVTITIEKLCVWVYDLEYQPNIEFLKKEYAISVKREKDKDVKFEVLIQQPIESHPTKPYMVFLAENDSGKVIINHSKIDENGILTSFPVKSVTRPEKKETSVVDKPKYVRPWREHDFTFNHILSRQNIIFESRGRYLEDFQPKPDYGITVKQKNHHTEVNFEDEITITYFPKTGDEENEKFDKRYSLFELNDPIELLEPEFKISFEGSLAAIAQIKFKQGIAVLDEVQIFSIKYTQKDGNIGVIEGVRKLSDGIRAAELQAENLLTLEITLDDKKTHYAANTLPKIRLNYGQINDREQERLKIIKDAARKKQQISDWRKEVLEKIPTKSPVAYSYSDDLDWQYGFLWYKAKDRHWPNILDMAKIEISRQYANKELVQDVKIVRPLNSIEENQYNEKSTEWAKRLRKSKDEFEYKVRLREEHINRRQDIYNKLEFLNPVAFKIAESWDYGFYVAVLQIYAEIIDIRVSKEINGTHIREISVDTPIRMLNDSEQKQYDEESTPWAKNLRESKRVVEWREEIYNILKFGDILAYKIDDVWEYGFYLDCYVGEINDIEVSKEYKGDKIKEITIDTPIRILTQEEKRQYDEDLTQAFKMLKKSRKDFEDKKKLEIERQNKIEYERQERLKKQEQEKIDWQRVLRENHKINYPIAYKKSYTGAWSYGFLVSIRSSNFYVSNHYRTSHSSISFSFFSSYCRLLNKEEELQFEQGIGWAEKLTKSKTDYYEQKKKEKEFDDKMKPYYDAIKANGKKGDWVAFVLNTDRFPPKWKYGKIKYMKSDDFKIEHRVSVGRVRSRRGWGTGERIINYLSRGIRVMRNIDATDPDWIKRKSDSNIQKRSNKLRPKTRNTHYHSSMRDVGKLAEKIADAEVRCKDKKLHRLVREKACREAENLKKQLDHFKNN